MPHPLDDIRTTAGLTIVAVCHAAGITVNGWYGLKRAKRGAHASTVFGLAAALQTTPDAIMARLCPRATNAL